MRTSSPTSAENSGESCSKGRWHPYASRMIRGIAGQFRRARVYRDKGATAVEYAFIAALIAAVIIAGVTLVGAATSDNFGTVNF